MQQSILSKGDCMKILSNDVLHLIEVLGEEPMFTFKRGVKIVYVMILPFWNIYYFLESLQGNLKHYTWFPSRLHIVTNNKCKILHWFV